MQASCLAMPPQYYGHLPPILPDLSSFQIMPPLRPKVTETYFPQVPNNPVSERSDHKERNRIAAQKWRQKQDGYMGELEESNDELRCQIYKLQKQVCSLRVENKVLEGELQFFQRFMSKIMSPNSQ